MLRLAWQRHYAYEQGEVRFKGSKEIPKEDPEVELRLEARYSAKAGREWVGYKVHLTESCDIDGVGLITKVITTPALTQDVSCTEVIQRPLMAKGLRPEEFNQDRLDIDWDIERVTFPKGKRSSRWILKRSEAGMPSILRSWCSFEKKTAIRAPRGVCAPGRGVGRRGLKVAARSST